MKKLLVLLLILISSNIAFSSEDCGCSKQTKCLDLMTSRYNERAALYNVLNLSDDQQKCKDVIDKKRYDELGAEFKKYEQEKFVLDKMTNNGAGEKALKQQQNVVKNIEKCMKKISEKYDKEFRTVLNSQQKSKLKTIRKMEEKSIKNCQKNKAFYKQDPNLRPFGTYGNPKQTLCPVHNKWHLFGRKHKIN